MLKWNMTMKTMRKIKLSGTAAKLQHEVNVKADYAWGRKTIREINPFWRWSEFVKYKRKWKSVSLKR
jgi:hypothetical protein